MVNVLPYKFVHGALMPLSLITLKLFKNKTNKPNFTMRIILWTCKFHEREKSLLLTYLKDNRNCMKRCPDRQHTALNYNL